MADFKRIKLLSLSAVLCMGFMMMPALAQGVNAKDPCPVPSEALGNTPDDLAKIQSDIDRFTLCVERASLLDRLNQMSIRNSETVAGGANLSNPGFQLNQQNQSSAPSASAGSVAQQQFEFDLSSLNADGPPPRRNEPAQVNDNDFVDDLDEDAGDVWRIESISGVGGRLTAKLIGPDALIVYVVKGDIIGDEIIVQDVTSSGVTLLEDGEKKRLEWRG